MNPPSGHHQEISVTPSANQEISFIKKLRNKEITPASSPTHQRSFRTYPGATPAPSLPHCHDVFKGHIIARLRSHQHQDLPTPSSTLSPAPSPTPSRRPPRRLPLRLPLCLPLCQHQGLRHQGIRRLRHPGVILATPYVIGNHPISVSAFPSLKLLTYT